MKIIIVPLGEMDLNFYYECEHIEFIEFAIEESLDEAEQRAIQSGIINKLPSDWKKKARDFIMAKIETL